MRPRLYALLSSVAVGLGMLIGGPAPGAGQPAQAVANATRKPTLPRLPDGHPDLQGYWTNATFTPLERSPELAGKEFFTEAEAAAYEKARLLRENSQAKDDLHYDNVIWQGENYWKILSNRRTSLIFDPPDGRIPPLTPNGEKLAAARREAARRRAAAESVQSRSLAERCITWGADGPPMLGTTYNANLQIVQTGESMVILHEMIHGVRVIPLDGRPHIPPSIRQLAGDSRGRWEGDTLVVDSSNFTDETNFRGPPSNARQDIFSSRDLHVIERFTATDNDTIVYRFTVEDPSVWTKPWSGELLLRRTAGPMLEYACHEGNYGLTNILAGARVAEKAAAGAGAAVAGPRANAGPAQNPPPADHPAVTVQGRTYTPRSILARNMGTPEDQTSQFPPHKIVGNIYYVGTRTLSSFLVSTPAGHILIDSTYERNVRTIEKSVTDLGFAFSDVKILLGSHAHGDHQEGDALVKQLTGAQVMAMAEDVPALEAMKPGGKEHPIDRRLRDGEAVTLGGTTLVAHLTPGHTRGCTTWTTTVQEGGRTYNVVFSCSLRAPAVLTPAIVAEMNRSFTLVRTLPCDVQVGDHPAQYNMHEKYAKLQKGGPNPFVDPATCTLEADIQEAMFKAVLAEQPQAARP